MKTEPSRTAMLSAAARAGHLLVYGPRALVTDWLAWPLVGPDADMFVETARALIGEHAIDYATWHAARTRLTEDWLAASQAPQYAILGAGLDSFAWRQTGTVEVYEFDHQATQGWKRSRLDKLDVPYPNTVTMVEANFEEQSVADVIETSVDLERPLFVGWLGVLPYLTAAAITTTLTELPPCWAAITYVLPEPAWDAPARTFAPRLVPALAELGEPVLTFTIPEQTRRLLEAAGFSVVEDLGADDVTARFGLPCVSHERIVLAKK